MIQPIDRSSLPFSSEQLQKIVASQEGAALLSLLRSGGGDTLTRAAQAAQSGNYASAQELLAPLLHSAQAQTLLQKLGEKACE